ncbi:hypothetical protein HKCCE2091_01455 [Rhodobacterales bacterium HKCCE2091]|nr:hypothetical protein [Rhodobacterales bacterium HKCCE2091]
MPQVLSRPRFPSVSVPALSRLRGQHPLAGLRAAWRRASVAVQPVLRLDARDATDLVDHYMALDPSDRGARFNSVAARETLERRYSDLDWDTSRVLGIRSGGRLVAVAEIAVSDLGGLPCRELAVSVLGPWQRAGLGERLVRRAIRGVCEHEHLPLVLYTRASNVSMVRLCARLGARGETLYGDHVAVFDPA